MSDTKEKRTSWRPRTLAEAVDAVRDEPAQLDLAMAGFLDEFYAHPDARAAAIADAPARLGRVENAWIGAVAEHLARVWALPIPIWTEDSCRFLARPYFAGGLESVKAILLAESPFAFRRRQIFVEADPLRRAGRPPVAGVDRA